MLRIVLDAGHGLHTSGKRVPSSTWVPEKWRGIREWTLNDDIARRVEVLLKPYNTITVKRSDDVTGATDVAISARRNKDKNAHLFLSIHHNAGLNGKSGGGVVVYRYVGNNAALYHAQHLYNSVIMRCGNAGNRSCPVAADNFGVINPRYNAARVSLLIECGFMDGPDDLPKIMSETYKQGVAQGIAEYILGAFKGSY